MELRINASKWRRKRGVSRLLDALGADEGLTRFVGGAVRDDLLNLPVSDVDLATRLKPEEVVELVNVRDLVGPGALGGLRGGGRRNQKSEKADEKQSADELPPHGGSPFFKKSMD